MRAVALLLLVVLGCRVQRSEVRSQVHSVAPGVARELPPDWAAVAPSVFEDRVEALAGREVRWSEEDLAELAAALGEHDGGAVRAAVLLGHDEGAGATEVLIARLERRRQAPTRGLDAGDLVAAAALEGRGVEERLVALAVGEERHPDLEVRVECARTALRAGREEVVPFLLTVLRALTPAEREHPGDWERTETMMWAKSRAGEALSDRLGIERRVRPDASWEEQMAEADRLEALFAEER